MGSSGDRHIGRDGNLTAGMTRLCLAAITAIALLLPITIISTLPVAAYATTSAEIQTQIDDLTEEIVSAEAKRDAAYDDFGYAATELYKMDSSGAIVLSLVSADNVPNLLASIAYLTAVSLDCVDTADKAQATADELGAKKSELGELLVEQKAREEAWARADEIHFPQGGGMPWSNLSYWGANVAYAGCGLCAYTSVVDILTGASYTPTEMLDIRGDWVGMESSVSDASGTPDGSSHHDFTLGKFGIESYESGIRDSEAFADELSKPERVAIVCARGTVFHNKDGSYRYTDGHYVCVYKLDDEGFHVQDPAVQDANIVYTYDEMQRLLNGTSSVVFYAN